MSGVLNDRYQSDRRQYGGMMMITGFCAIIQSIGNVVSNFGPDGAINTDAGEVPFWRMIGAFCLFINGMFAVLIGYMACVHDWSHPMLTLFMIVIIQTAWIPYISDMTHLGKLARRDPGAQMLVPPGHEPTETDVKFVGSMGVCAIFCYGFAFVGALSFMTFCLHVYNIGEYQTRCSGYFKGRLGFYSLVLALGGIVQLALGAYCADNFGAGTLDEGRIRAAMLVVNYPVVSIIVGLVQVVHGLWGIARSMGVHSGPGDYIYQISMAVQWLMVLCLQDVMQLAYLPGDMMAALAPGLAAVSFGINMMPAFLDHKMRNTPEEFPEHYFIQVPQQEAPKAVKGMDASAKSMGQDMSVSNIKETYNM